MKGDHLQVSEWFTSIQGEGTAAGTPALFLRLSGCNLRCRYCDTRYAWEGGRRIGVAEVAEVILSSSLEEVVITGGEPLLQEKRLLQLVKLLGKAKRLHLETNGTLWNQQLLEGFHLVTVSPKPPSMSASGINHQVLQRYHLWHGPYQVKVLVGEENDWAEVEVLLHAYPRWGREVPLVIQPLCTHRELAGYLHASRKTAEAFLRRAERWRLPRVRFMPQLHKVLWWGEEER